MKSDAFAHFDASPVASNSHTLGPSLAQRPRELAKGGGPTPRTDDPPSNSRGTFLPLTFNDALVSNTAPGVEG